MNNTVTVFGCGADVLEKNLCYEISIWRHKSQHRESLCSQGGPFCGTLRCHASAGWCGWCASWIRIWLGMLLWSLMPRFNVTEDPNKSMIRVLQPTLQNKKLLGSPGRCIKASSKRTKFMASNMRCGVVECCVNKNPFFSSQNLCLSVRFERKALPTFQVRPSLDSSDWTCASIQFHSSSMWGFWGQFAPFAAPG